MATTELTKEVSTETKDPPPEEELTSEDEARMTFIEHLGELRDRIVYSAIAIAVSFLICYIGSDYIYAFIKQPLSPIADKVREATADEGIFVSRFTKDGEVKWDKSLGVYLEGAELAGQTSLFNGKMVMVANRTTAEDTNEGVLVLLAPTGEDKEYEFEPQTVQIWRGARLSGVTPAIQGEYNVTWTNLTNEKEGIKFEIVDILKDGEVVGDFEKAVVEAGIAAAAGQWTVLSPLEAFFVKLKLAGYFGLGLALPFVLWQGCAFVFPGLKGSERMLVRIMLAGCGFFAVLGVAMSYAIIFPLVLPFLLEWAPEDVLVQFRMSETVSIILKGMLAFGIAFQMPMVVLVLVWLDLITPETLTQYRRIAIVIMAAGSALLTPPDPGSLILMLIPLWLLYEMSIFMAKIVVWRRKNREPEGAV